MVSAGTKRKRKERGNRIAAAVEDGRAKAAAEKRVLGTQVKPDVPDAALFVEDRKGVSKVVLQENLTAQAAEQRRAAKRARRQAPKERKSEIALRQNPNVKSYDMSKSLPGKKKKKGIATVEAEILAKRKFDKPRGHVGNRSEVIRQGKMHIDGKEDVWMSEVSRKVQAEVGIKRQRIVNKTQTAQRSAAQVICPRDGLSMNPIYTDHQDKLGEALATIVKRDGEMQLAEEKMEYDPALLKESTEGEIADTGMKGDVSDEESEVDGSDDEVVFFKGATERKTRSQRHKESRKREMERNIAKKKANARQESAFKNIDEVTRKAQEVAEKLNGEAKLKRLEDMPESDMPIDQPVLEKVAGQTVRRESVAEPVVFSSELSKSMRSVKMPVANPMLRDRILSFERRGLIVPPKVLPKEAWRMEQAKQQDLLRDKRKRKGRGSRSNLTFWKNGKRVIQ